MPTFANISMLVQNLTNIRYLVAFLYFCCHAIRPHFPPWHISEYLLLLAKLFKLEHAPGIFSTQRLTILPSNTQWQFLRLLFFSIIYITCRICQMFTLARFPNFLILPEKNANNWEWRMFCPSVISCALIQTYSTYLVTPLVWIQQITQKG